MMLTAARPTPATLLPGSSFANANAEVDAAKADLDGFQRRLDDTNHILSLSRRERIQNYNTQVGSAMWNEKAKFHSGVAAHLAIFAAAGLGAAAMLTGVCNPIVGVAAGFGLAYGYVMGMKHIGLPFQIDKVVKPALEQEKRDLTSAIESCKTRVQTAEANLLKGIQASLQGTQSAVHVDEAAVTVGGVRIRVRR